MHANRWFSAGLLCAATALSTLMPSAATGQASPYRGLWIGSAALTAVNEVTIPLDENNIPIAPNPEVPTASFDRADLRLIVHVNGAGQAFLLKDVAILNRVHGQTTNGAIVLAGESDIALVTDPRLYAEFPPQPAMRYASAVFDFGDAKATEALDTVVETAALQAMAFTTNASLPVGTQGERVQARNDAVALIRPQLANIILKANVAEGFNQFLLQFNSAALNAIVLDTSDPVVAALTNAAILLRDQSFYKDTRALDMVEAVVAAVEAADPSDRAQAAHYTASSFADVQNLYQRFISGSTVGDMIDLAAVAAGPAANAPGATAASIELALRALPKSVQALTEALQARVPAYNDGRATDAVNAVLAAMAEAAYDLAGSSSSEIRTASQEAGRMALADMVARYPLPVLTPTLDYNQFIVSGTATGAPAIAAFAAADAAIQERAINPLYTPLSLYSAAKLASVKALESAYRTAARVMRTELPLAGEFAPGSGDTTPIADLAQPSDLGPPGLTGLIYLPASHPTNPFRHRRHPDHTTGYNIQRVIRFDFDGVAGDALEPAGFGVDKISGIYREEIFGLHKPLGPEPDANPIGLRTEGRFQLTRISLIDALNTR
ncbi:MAG TPA: hypothetical protein PKA51_04960 [Kiritimatiellia bacterium]|nr:hypothetical protein [Kiritimatiellia bacterium]